MDALVDLEVVDLPAEAVSVSTELMAKPVEVIAATIMAEIVRLETAAAAVAITDRASADGAALLLTQTNALAKSIETTRVMVKRPFLDITQKIDEAARQPTKRLNDSKEKLSKAIAAHVDAEEAKARKAQEEADRKRREEEAAAAKAEQDARKAAEASGDELLDIDVAEDKPAPVIVAPARPAPLAGVRVQKALGCIVTDISLVPEKYLKPREVALAKVMAELCVGWTEGKPIPSVPGLQFTASTVANATGRR